MADLNLKSRKGLRQAVRCLHGIDLDIKPASSSCSSVHRAAASRPCCASIAGLEEITGGTLKIDRRGRQRRAAVQARHRHGVPVLRALSAYDRVRQHGLLACRSPSESKAEIDKRVQQRRRNPAADQLSRPPAQGDVGRPAPARRHRPRHRAQSEGLPVRRAAVEPRRRSARRRPASRSPSSRKRCRTRP